MRRWRSWGDEGVTYPAPPAARTMLERAIGPGQAFAQPDLSEVLNKAPASRLPDSPYWDTSPHTRLLHARGQSLPDWIRLGAGAPPAWPDAVAFPQSHQEAADLLARVVQAGAVVIPYGGGTSVAGHLTPPAGERPVLTVSLARMNRLLDLGGQGRWALFQAGIPGPQVEAELRAHGFTLGHYPQSFEYSTLGGWVATRSVGQFSLGYGRMDSLYLGGRLATPAGDWDLPPFPASAAGPDLRQMVLGSEGRLGLITDCRVKIRPLPELERVEGAFLPHPQAGLVAARGLARVQPGLAMIRLSLPKETETSLSLSAGGRGRDLLEALCRLKGIGRQRCLLLFGVSGGRRAGRAALAQARSLVRAQGGLNLGRRAGAAWYAGRFRLPYLRNTLWDMGYAVDTLETACLWERVPELMPNVQAVLAKGLEQLGERVHVFCHLSHVYAQGTSLYFTFIFRRHGDPEHDLARWRLLKHAASRVIVQGGGTISHQHGVGRDHRDFLAVEKGGPGMALLRGACAALDPAGMMNPGKLLAGEDNGE